MRRLLLCATTLLLFVGCGRSPLGFGDEDGVRRPDQVDASIQPDAGDDVDDDIDDDTTPGGEICDNGEDDDRDGRVDCDDSDCIDAAVCAVADCPEFDIGSEISIEAPLLVFVPESDTVLTTCGDEDSPETTIAWTAPFTGQFTVFADGPVFALEVRAGTCAGAAVDCGTFGSVPFLAIEGERFVFVVEGEPDETALFIDGTPVATREDCFDGIDNDGDRAVDCDDPDCFEVCGPGFEFDCANGFDDDGDGRIDCDDPDCFGAPECSAECPLFDLGDAVGQPVVSTPTFAAPNLVNATCVRDGNGEVSLSWFAPATGVYRISTEGSEVRLPVHVRADDCNGREQACSAIGTVEIEAFEGQRFVLFVEGFDGDERIANLSIVLVEGSGEFGQCDDGADNDRDGFIDCADADCLLDPACGGPVFEVCDDGVDNDGDRLIDCDDPECAFAPICAGTERICDDGIDNDGDGRIDCRDPDCARDPFCGGAVEICFNGRDDDGDGLVDCNDPDCFDDDACFEPEDCDNRFDDDRDGRIDCDDPDCVNAPNCRPDVENCFNGIDDDGDRRIDCNDSDCFDAPECAPGPTCPDGDLGRAIATPVIGGSTNDAGNDASGSCGGGGAPERAFSWTAPVSGTFVFDTRGSEFDTLLYARFGDCDGFELACNDDAGGTTSEITLDLDEGQTIVLFVDGFGASSGLFALSIRAIGVESEFGFCSDGIDNDRDGRIDCGDSDCARDPACRVVENCANGRDDDRDGLIDCADPECFGDPVCLAPEDCFNGRDDDGDGLVDCDDFDCVGLPECFDREICFNGRDDDGDGLVDCADPDCINDPSCPPGVEICDNGRDDDGDGLIDCADRECLRDPACRRVEDCANGIDDDFDRRVDCADPDCFGSDVCASPIEICENGVDDDDDGATDCEDPDCFGNPACLEPTCPAANLGRAVGNAVARGTTEGGTNDGGGTCGGGDAPDVTFAWQAPATGQYVLDTSGSDYDTILHLRDGSCDGELLECDDDGVRPGGPSRIVRSFRLNQRVVIFVDGWNTSSGNFQLNINRVEDGTEAGFCFDGIDNDDDGQIDCGDPDCFGDPACGGGFEDCTNGFDDDFDGRIDCGDPDCFDTPFCGGVAEVCFDGVDNDGDGRVDCADPDCFDTPFCLFTEICTNGFDDDRNGLVDCDDPACFDDPSCLVPRPEECTNGLDDDFDGRVDCADTDCFIDPACFFSENCSNGVDDDGDGFVDCADPSCFFDPSCPTGEICGNGRDDDGDRLVDCDDPECVFDPSCEASEDCANGIDDDGDGLVDCDDLTCVLNPVCQIPENCFNGFDDDGDGAVDCDDSECAAVPACAAPICPNGSIGSAVGTGVAQGTTAGGGNEIDPSCVGGAAEDVAFTWTAPRAGRYEIDTEGSNYDTVLVVFPGETCDGPQIACDDDEPSLGTRSLVRIDAERGETFTIAIDGFGTSSGDFRLNIRRLPATEAGLCLNGLDDDRDGTTDCDDIDCATDPVCGAPEQCDNGVDDDFDGAIDCGDEDCAGSPLCAAAEVCDNGIDDDDDGDIDCEDADCADSDECALTCPARDIGSRLGASVAVGTTVGAPSEVAGSCAGGSGPEISYAWRAPVSGRFRIDTFGSSYDTQLHVRLGDCDGAEVVCNDDTGGQQSSVVLPLTAGSSVVIFVDGFGAGSQGDYVLNITRVLSTEAGVCTDGVDNDGDGTTDCGDADCFTDPACISPEICFNGVDDDRDGATDCDDTDCFGFPTCGEPEICDNGEDDDLDGAIDCADADCSDSPACFECPAFDIGTSTGEFVFIGTPAGQGDRLEGSCSLGGEDLRIGWTAPGPGRYVATTAGSAGPAVLYARRGGCDGAEIACSLDLDAEIQFTARGGQQVVFGIEALDSDVGDVALSIFQIPTNETGLCFDGRDNDADGVTDCEDTDCATDPLCALPEVCDNGFDDDLDGLTDCEDDDCFGDPACFTGDEVCTNGIDDDRDGATDCADSTCVLTPECIGAENCGNGIDDDGNGRVDCEDPSCSVDPSCFLSENCNNGVDDDGDTLVDCDDPSCAIRPACQGANRENCGNGIDDDDDGLVDCDDFGCVISFECIAFP